MLLVRLGIVIGKPYFQDKLSKTWRISVTEPSGKGESVIQLGHQLVSHLWVGHLVISQSASQLSGEIASEVAARQSTS